MTETITCPFSWGRTMVKPYDSGIDYLKLGYGNTLYGEEFRMIMKFDLSNLANVAPSKIAAVGLKLYMDSLVNVTTQNSVGYEILKSVTNQAGWFKYDGTNSWSSPGASGSGTDHYATALGTRLWASIGYSTMNIDPNIFKLMWSNNNAMAIFPTGGRQTGESFEGCYFNDSTYPPYLEVTIRPGSSYIMMF